MDNFALYRDIIIDNNNHKCRLQQMSSVKFHQNLFKVNYLQFFWLIHSEVWRKLLVKKKLQFILSRKKRERKITGKFIITAKEKHAKVKNVLKISDSHCIIIIVVENCTQFIFFCVIEKFKISPLSCNKKIFKKIEI